MRTPNLEAVEDALATSLAARVEEILKPYQEREGADGFQAIVIAEAEDVLAMPYSLRDLAISVCSYRRKAADQNALAMIAMEALEASESYRDGPKLSGVIGDAMGVVTGAGRPAREFKRALEAIKDLYPSGVPHFDRLSHAGLVRQVFAACKAARLEPPSRETVIRARQQIEKDQAK